MYIQSVHVLNDHNINQVAHSVNEQTWRKEALQTLFLIHWQFNLGEDVELLNIQGF